jgi:hypothetical protein
MSETSPIQGGEQSAAAGTQDPAFSAVAGLASAMRAAQDAAAQAPDAKQAVVDGFGAAATALHAFQQGNQNETGTQCLLYPGPGNGNKVYNYDTGEWGDAC